MQNQTQGIWQLFNSVLVLVGILISLAAFAAPQLVTPQRQPSIQVQASSAPLFIGSTLPLSSAGATGLPAGMAATHNGIGTLAISGTPTATGSFTVTLTATDNAAGTLKPNATRTIINGQVASNASALLGAISQLRGGQRRGRALGK